MGRQLAALSPVNISAQTVSSTPLTLNKQVYTCTIKPPSLPLSSRPGPAPSPRPSPRSLKQLVTPSASPPAPDTADLTPASPHGVERRLLPRQGSDRGPRHRPHRASHAKLADCELPVQAGDFGKFAGLDARLSWQFGLDSQRLIATYRGGLRRIFTKVPLSGSGVLL
jgi:hypothetical protein